MLSDLDSLTEPESLVMAAAAAAAANSQASHQQQASAAITQQSQQQLEDEMLLLRLMDIPSQQQLNVTGIHYTFGKPFDKFAEKSAKNTKIVTNEIISQRSCRTRTDRWPPLLKNLQQQQ